MIQTKIELTEVRRKEIEALIMLAKQLAECYRNRRDEKTDTDNWMITDDHARLLDSLADVAEEYLKVVKHAKDED